MNYEEYFKRLAGSNFSPYDWQADLAKFSQCVNRLIRIPTGFGKTLGVLSAWIWNRIISKNDQWPRRLVWCLPMRVLVEQTEQEARKVLATAGVLWSGDDHRGKTGVHLLMGGADAGEWHLYPEECAVLIGTQDMLLSRAMNRGYASPRARWPMEFGLLNQDCLWVMDEVQLMDVGLATSMQLQAFRDEDTGAKRTIRPCFTWWMSATLQPEWMKKSPDTLEMAERLDHVGIPESKRVGHLWDDVRKPVRLEAVTDEDALAKLVVKEYFGSHAEIRGLCLVVVNRVETAVNVHELLCKNKKLEEFGVDIRLLHSRFRPVERICWRGDFLNRETCTPDRKRIIVSTQVVEAGVDISAVLLITELAPWANLVQRFGRCARWGGDGGVIVADMLAGHATAAWEKASKKYEKEVQNKPSIKKPDQREVIDQAESKAALPYNVDETRASRKALGFLSDVAPLHLDVFEEAHPELLPQLYPFDPTHLLLRHEIDELFDTTPDLSGADIDISRFIRTGDERDVRVFWSDVPEKSVPSAATRPVRDALCAVPFIQARNWIFDEKSKNRKIRAWVWDWLDGSWKKAQSRDIYPGQTVLVAADSGGYDAMKGWSPESVEPVTVVPDPEHNPEDAADAHLENEAMSAFHWQTIAVHGLEAGRIASEIAQRLAPAIAPLFDLAGRFHDVGKAHPAFQNSISGPERPVRQDIAKAPKEAWLSLGKMYPMKEEPRRAGFRHEAVSTLFLFSVLQRLQPDHPALLGPWRELLEAAGLHPLPPLAQDPPVTSTEREILDLKADEFNLVAYLICAHHGKARMAWHAGPKDQEANDERLRIMGLKDGDRLPEVYMADSKKEFHKSAGFIVDLSLAAAGLNSKTGMGWTERVLKLLQIHGPFTLAWMEAMFRAADQRASRLSVKDQLLHPEEKP